MFYQRSNYLVREISIQGGGGWYRFCTVSQNWLLFQFKIFFAFLEQPRKKLVGNCTWGTSIPFPWLEISLSQYLLHVVKTNTGLANRAS